MNALAHIILRGSIQGDVNIPGGSVGIVRAINEDKTLDVHFEKHRVSFNLPYEACYFIAISAYKRKTH